MPEEIAESLIGARLGPYRIAGEIGKGGMGDVYLAVRDDSAFELKVAIKVVKRGMDSDAVLDRFRYERRILASLNHPYISRLLDGGTTADGRPYFAMEFVEGRPITQFCNAEGLSLSERLDLFRKVCDAVSFAHRKLVIHRDLKAGNIMVGADGSPKLLDFGIAKLLDPQNPAEVTSPAHRMLTLECASPEQLRGDSVTTATDIYSLGLLLFELLAGRPAWDLTGYSYAEAEQIICFAPPPKPSSVRPLSADLDNIVAMALRKDPARRYRSVDEFSEDILRSQTGRPVVARKDSFSYRATKFLRRHWVAAAVTFGAVAALVAGFVYANLERRRAEVRLNEMLAMADQTLLDLQAQIERQPSSTETRMRITKSTLAYLDGLAKDAGNNQDVRSTLGKAYLATGDIQGYPDDPNLGDSAGALSSYAEAVKLFGPGDRIPRGRLYWHRGVVLFKLGRVPEGVASLKKALDETEPLDTHDSLLVAAGALHSLAYALTPSNPEEALADARREMQIYSKLASREPGNLDFQNGLAQSYFTIGGALIRRNRIEEALDLYRASAGILESLVAKHPNDYLVGRDLLNAYARIGDVLGNPARRNLGDSRGALTVYQKAIAIANAHIAADPNDHLAQMDRMELLWRIGVTMENPDETAASLKILDEAHTAASPKPGGAPTTAQIRALALIDQFRGKRLVHANDGNGAVAAYKRSIEQAQLLIKKDPTDSSGWTIGLVAYSGLTPALAGLGRREEAIRLARQAIEEANQVLTSGSDKVALAIYVPRTAMWLAQTYEALAQKGASNQQRREDYLIAAENYANAAAEWQKLHSRADFVRFQSEAADCAKKSAECRRKAG